MATAHVDVSEQLKGSQFSSAMWVPGTELRSMTSTINHRTIASAVNGCSYRSDPHQQNFMCPAPSED